MPAARTRGRKESASRIAAREDAHEELMLAVLMQFRVIVRSIRKHYAQVERQCGVSGAQLWAMATICASSGLKVTELAHTLAIHQSTASNLLESLDRAGMTERRRVAEDRRLVRVYLTDQGRRALRRAPRPLRGALQQALAELSRTRLAALHASLAQLIAHMKQGERDGRTMVIADILSNGRGGTKRGSRGRQDDRSAKDTTHGRRRPRRADGSRPLRRAR